MSRRSSFLAVFGILAATTLSACQGAAESHAPAAQSHGQAGSASKPAAASPVGGTEPAGHKVGLVMGMPSALGQILTDDYMLTLYRSDNDTASPPKSNCV